MESIRNTVQNIIQDLAIKKKRATKDKHQILLQKILTKREVGHIKFSYLKKGVLNIGVDSSSWLYHLSLQKEGLLAKLRKRLSDIKDIRFCLGG